jgi:hypothetical protein
MNRMGIPRISAYFYRKFFLYSKRGLSCDFIKILGSAIYYVDFFWQIIIYSSTALLTLGCPHGCPCPDVRPRPDANTCNPFHAPHVGACAAPKRQQHREEGEEAAPACASGSDAQPAPGGGDTEARQQKARRGCNTRSTFETSRCNTCNIRLKTDETLETCI